MENPAPDDSDASSDSSKKASGTDGDAVPAPRNADAHSGPSEAASGGSSALLDLLAANHPLTQREFLPESARSVDWMDF